jgi:uncharacterized protein (DUF952 family)
MIFHIAQREIWEQARMNGEYRVESLMTEGFIHLSTRSQFLRVANFLFQGQTDLVLLEVDETLLKCGLRYDPVGEERFPHLYGPLNLEAVVRVHEFPVQADGTFQAPATLK